MEGYQNSPCRQCRKCQCEEEKCGRWQMWFLESWAAVNRYAWAVQDELGRQEPRGFVYELPHMVKNPCLGCKCEAWCDTPCSARLKWWNRCVGKGRIRTTPPSKIGDF
jgi:hypothetical protein